MLRKLYQGVRSTSGKKSCTADEAPEQPPGALKDTSGQDQASTSGAEQFPQQTGRADISRDSSRPGSLDAFQKPQQLKATGKQGASGDSAYVGRPSGMSVVSSNGNGSGNIGTSIHKPISDDSAYTPSASKSLLDAGPRLRAGASSLTTSRGSQQNISQAAAGSSALSEKGQAQQLRPSMDSARVAGSWQSLHTDTSDDSQRTRDTIADGAGSTGRPSNLQPHAAAGKPASQPQRQRAGSAAAVQQDSSQRSRADKLAADLNAHMARRSGQHEDEPAAARRPSADAQAAASMAVQRASIDSMRSAADSGHSQRSSFALERASLEGARRSLEAFGGASNSGGSSGPPEGPPASYEVLEKMCDKLGIPKAMRDRYLKLAVVPDNTPLPMTMLTKLWRVPSDKDAEATANLMEQRGIMRVACLYDGSAWALVDAQHLKRLQAAQWSSIPQVHGDLLDDYKEGHEQLAEVLDDGYILQNAGHHLVGAKRLRDLKCLISDPAWLELKLHSYGVASVVADFRRFLMVSADNEVKMLLEALQMSVSSCMQHPEVAMLRSQMVGRLMTVQRLQDWSSTQRQRAAATPAPLHCLLPKTPTLEQAGGLHRMVLRGHTGGITKVLLTSGGIDVVTASTDGTARVWDMEIGDCVLLLEGHTGPITDLAASADSTLLVTGSADRTARVWSLDKGHCLSVLAGHTSTLHGLAVDPHGRFAVTASADGTVRVWDLASGQCAHVLTAHGTTTASTGVVWAVALTPDGRQAITASEDFTARVWDIVSGTCVRVLEGHTGWVVDVAVSSDGTHAMTAAHDGTARVWHLSSGMCSQILEGHANRLNAIKLAGTGTTAITVSDDYTARVWDWSTGKCRHLLEGHGGWLSDVALVHNGSRAVTVSGDDLAVVWDLQAGACINVLEGHSGEVRTVVLTRRGRFAVTGSEDTTARVWDLSAGPSSQEQGHNGRVHSLTVSADGNTAVSIGDDASAKVWDVATGRCTHTLQGHASGLRWCHVSADGTVLLTASGDRMVKTWQLERGECTHTHPSHQGSRVKSFSASADGSQAVIVLFDSTVGVWDMHSMECKCMLQRWGDRDAARVHSGGVNAAYLVPDGSRALTVSKDQTARVWDLATGTCSCVMQGHTDGIFMGSLNADAQLFLTASFDQTCRVWDVDNGSCLAVLSHEGQVKHAAITPDGTCAVTVTADHQAHLWDLSTGTATHHLQGHRDDICATAFSQDSVLVATCSCDCTARVWSVETGQLQGFFSADCSLSQCAFAMADGKPDTLLVSGPNGVVHFLQL